jgi:hypothetical protein
MTDIMRSCSRTGCRWPATAALSFRYSSRQAWLLDLGDPDPALYDLCPHHADALVVPRGWHRVDQRAAALQASGQEPAQVPEPVACLLGPAPAQARASGAPRREHEPVPVTAGGAPPAPARVNRYQDLVSDLPRLAAEFAPLRDVPSSAKGAGRRVSRPSVGDGVIVPLRVPRRSPRPDAGQDG